MPNSAAGAVTSQRLSCHVVQYAAEHQLAVVDCLEDRDDTLKKKTLELLFKMTKPNNVEVRAPQPSLDPSHQVCSKLC